MARKPRGSTTPKGMLPPLDSRSTRARQQRAHDRALDRETRNITVFRKQKLSARIEIEAKEFLKKQIARKIQSPFGPVTKSKFPTKDPAPKITTSKDDYDGEPVGHKYKELSPLVFPKIPKATNKRQRESDSAIAGELLDSMENDKRPAKAAQVIRAGKQQNAAAKMTTIGTLSEPVRVPGSAKVFRGVLRGIQKTKVTPQDAFETDNPLFSMAVKPSLQRRIMNRPFATQTKPPPPPKGFLKLGGYMSDSSEDEY